VIENSPAAKAGIHGSDKTIQVDGVSYPTGGDIILSVDGKEVRKIDDILIHLQRSKSVGDKMSLEILRDGRTTNVTITLEERTSIK
jgi:S1-C subfamily serine protease